MEMYGTVVISVISSQNGNVISKNISTPKNGKEISTDK